MKTYEKQTKSLPAGGPKIQHEGVRPDRPRGPRSKIACLAVRNPMLGQTKKPRCQWVPAGSVEHPCQPAAGLGTVPCFIGANATSLIPNGIIVLWSVYYCFVFNAYVRPRARPRRSGSSRTCAPGKGPPMVT